MQLTLVTPAVKSPLELRDVAEHLRITDFDQDTLITSLMQAARDYVDGRNGCLGRALITQTWELALPKFPISEIRVPLPPLQSVTSVKYDDENDAEQTLAASNYQVDTRSRMGRLVLASGGTWPGTFDNINAVRVLFIAGYGTDATNVPMPIRQAMLLLVGHWFEHREAATIGPGGILLPLAVEALLSPFEIHSFT